MIIFPIFDRKCLKIPYVIDLNTIIDRDEKVIDLFIFIFPYYLKESYAKRVV